MAGPEKVRVAVIGGGVAAMTAVYGIMGDPELCQRYDITVYQLGWRLGGKGASGRDMARGGRIQEHGLHVWAGFYQNAFRLLRQCYGDLETLGIRKKSDPLGTIDKAFRQLDHLFLSERVAGPDGQQVWRPWLIDLPDDGGMPGTRTTTPSPFEAFLRLMAIVRDFVHDDATGQAASAYLGSEKTSKLREGVSGVHRHANGLHRDARSHAPAASSLLVDLIETAQRVIADLLTPEHLAHDATRRVLLLVDLSLAYARGMAATDVFTSGYDVLDQWEFTDWLRQNGASEAACDSVLLRGCYDFVFGFPAGRPVTGNVGAGTAIRAMSRLVLDYEGSIFWKMQAGMGDTIFAPYYLVLLKLGVKFRFFNAARRLRLDPSGQRIERIEMVEQAALVSGTYDPLVTVRDLPCWPSEPLWSQLVDGERLQREGVDFESEASPPTGRDYVLEAGRDFDKVLLGASIGSLGYLAQELSDASPRWRRMMGSVKTVGTQAAQFWLTRKQDALGWESVVAECNPHVTIPKDGLRTILTGFQEPLDTWADMSHLLPREDWPRGGPASIAYFCSPAPDGQTLDSFRKEAKTWANEDLTRLLVGAENQRHSGFAESDLYRLSKKGGDAFDDQYYRVNMHGSERYVLSVTDSVYHRLAPAESGFENLVIAGDWTRCGLNAGCVEAATMSGIAAASAITGKQMLNVGAEDIPIDETAQAKAMYETISISGAPWPLTGFFARGEMTGWFFFYLMPRGEVQQLLPPGMVLGQTRFARHGMHPVGVSLCRYHGVRGSFLPGFLAMSPYGEASFAVPFVRTEEAGAASFLYPHRLYVDNMSAIAAGKLFYAMNKAKAAIAVDESSFVARDALGRPFIEARFEQHEDPAPLRQHPAFGALTSLLDLPFVTQSPTHTLYNAFDMQLEQAWAAPISGHVTITDRQAGGFPPSRIEVKPLRNHDGRSLPGGLRLWCSWSMTNPLDSARIRHAAMARAWLGRTYGR
jgi:uncharacterized protein with NAD-binding domain and iron-sulfur cluster